MSDEPTDWGGPYYDEFDDEREIGATMHATTSRASTRRRNGRTFVLCDHGFDRADLELAAAAFDGASVCWESQGVTLASGERVGPRYVLWIPEGATRIEPAYEDLSVLLAEPAPAAARPWRRKTTKHKGITRVDRNAGRHADGRRITATHGYMARVPWQGQIHIKFFSDSVHGDRLGALAAALEWRNATERQLGKPRTEEPVFSVANSNTGVVGIHRQMNPQGKPEFEVSWVTPDGKNGRTSVSIAKHGERAALRKAQKIRAERERARLGA